MPDLVVVVAGVAGLCAVVLEVARQVHACRERREAAGEAEAERILCHATAAGLMEQASTPPPRPRMLQVAPDTAEQERVRPVVVPRWQAPVCLAVLCLLTVAAVALWPVRLHVPASPPEAAGGLEHRPPEPVVPTRVGTGKHAAPSSPPAPRAPRRADPPVEDVGQDVPAEAAPAPRHRADPPDQQEQETTDQPVDQPSVTTRSGRGGVDVDPLLRVKLTAEVGL